MNFGCHLKEIRFENNLSQKKMAILLLIDPSSYSRYETNIQTPNAELILRVAQQFNKSVDWLLDHENIDAVECTCQIQCNNELMKNNQIASLSALSLISQKQMQMMAVILELQINSNLLQTTLLNKIAENSWAIKELNK